MARGSIRQSPGHGKKIATFPFDVEQEANGRVIARKIEIDVFMQNRYSEDSPPPKMVTATQFYLSCEGETEYGSDLNACLKAMRSKLDRKYRIKWEAWLLVRVDPRPPYKGMGEGLVLSWESVERGVTLDGDVLLREFDAHGDFNNPWRISPWPEVYKDKSGKTIACVPQTEANEAALKTFAEKLTELRRTLAEFVAPDRINETLNMISNGQLRLLSKGD